MVIYGEGLTSFVAPFEVLPSQICGLVLFVAANIHICARAVKTSQTTGKIPENQSIKPSI